MKVEADLKKLPFPPGTLDRLVCSRVFSLFWVHDLPALLNTIGNVVRPGGEVWVVELNLQVLAHRYLANHTMVGDLNDIIFGGIARMSIWDEGMLVAAMEEVGFQEVTVLPVCDFPFCDIYEDYYTVLRAVRP